MNVYIFANWLVSFFFIGDSNRQISEYKFKLSKAEQEMGTMEQNVSEKEKSIQIIHIRIQKHYT